MRRDKPKYATASHAETSVLLSVLNGDRTHEDLVEATGYSRGHIHSCLTNLQELGLVGWVPNSKGTIHPTCRRVA